MALPDASILQDNTSDSTGCVNRPAHPQRWAGSFLCPYPSHRNPESIRIRRPPPSIRTPRITSRTPRTNIRTPETLSRTPQTHIRTPPTRRGSRAATLRHSRRASADSRRGPRDAGCNDRDSLGSAHPRIRTIPGAKARRWSENVKSALPKWAWKSEEPPITFSKPPLLCRTPVPDLETNPIANRN